MNREQLIAALQEERARLQTEVDWRMLQMERITQLLLGYEEEDGRKKDDVYTPIQQKAELTETREAAISPLNYKTKSTKRVKPGSQVEVLPEYKGKKISDELEHILKEAPDQAFHVDFVTKRLYGDLPKEKHKIASDRVRALLND